MEAPTGLAPAERNGGEFDVELPFFKAAAGRTRQQVLEWRGVQYGRTTQDGELKESLNLSSREYPAICQRMGRAPITGYTAPTAAFAKDKLAVVDGTQLFYDGQAVGTVTAGEKQIVQVNSKVCVFPDMVYYDADLERFGTMAVDVMIPAGKAQFTTQALTVTVNPAEGKTLEDLFAVNQAVEISGASIQKNNQTIIVRAVSGNTLTFYADSFDAGSSTTAVRLQRKMPALTYVCEAKNRLWGVDDATIWASALGDPLTFYNYDGLSTDSYAVSLGTKGRFTGICGYGSNVLIFEENAMHKIIGSEPTEYTIYSYKVPGVQAGSHKSLQIVNEVLYYKGEAGVYAYTGAAPSLSSDVFGTRQFDSARAGTDGQQYYISMKDRSTGKWGLWVLDTLRGIWLREDGTHVRDFFNLGSALCFLDDAGGLMQMGQADGAEGRMEWMAELAPFDWTTPERKQYTRLYLQAEMDAGAYIKVEIREDQTPWRQVCIHHAEHKRNFAIPIAPNRCDQLQIRLSGKGRCLVRQVTREYVMSGRR